MTYEIRDVTKTSLIGPRFLLEVINQGRGYHGISFHGSHADAETYFRRHILPYVGEAV